MNIDGMTDFPPQVTADQVTFCNLGGLTALTRILLVPDIASDKPPVKPIIPIK